MYLDTFCQINGLNVNDSNKGDTTKTLPHFTCKGEPKQAVQKIKYLGIKVPSTNR